MTLHHGGVMVQSKISEYLDAHHELVVEGFVNFRLKDYREKITQVVDKVADDFMLDVEYKEFIRVLRYFVEVQAPLLEEVHLIITGGHAFKILDASGNPISKSVFRKLYPAYDGRT